MRLGPQRSERLERDTTISFTFDGKAVSAHPGDTIASALLASGRRVLSRSFKYHRPRGEVCCAGRCANSLVDVDGWPGVRACSEPARDGMRVTHLNAWPSLGFDVMRAVDLFGSRLTPPGFYYKTFIRPRSLWPAYEHVLRHAAGLGRLSPEPGERQSHTQYRRRHCDVLVIGGGAAGLSGAIAAARSGADTVLVDDDLEPGGRLLAEGDHELARQLAREAAEAGVEVLAGASALGYFDGLVPVWQGETLHQIRAAAHVSATGTVEQPLLFENNDLPGVMSSRGARRLASLYAVPAGQVAVAAVSTDAGIDDALAVRRAGVELSAIIDLRPANEATELSASASAGGVRVLSGSAVVKAVGRRGLRGVTVASLDASGEPSAARQAKLRCDTLLVDGGEAPASSLLLQAGARASFEPGRAAFVPDELPASVFAAGGVVGLSQRDAALASGELAGLDAAAAIGAASQSSRRDELTDAIRELQPASDRHVASAPIAFQGKAFVDLDEDVTTKDIAYAAAEGYDSIELSKRYTTATMGPSQGRFSTLPVARALAASTGMGVDEIGMTTARPPWTPVPLGVLAGPEYEPAKRSSIHPRHRALGANVDWAGDWRRAYDYGDPAGEALAVQETAGLIDVSTLGKLLVHGPEAGAFLDRLYPNNLSNLAPERIRYGVLTSEAGRISDDGTICRLDDETFYVTTTSSGAGAVEQWFSWWLADWNMDVAISDVTQGLSAVNLAGPRAREILAACSDFDSSADAFKYLDAKQGSVAGVPCLAMRIGFVGEVGYELHFAAAYGEHLWDALSEAGAAAGLRPFGLEPQRILRLQKLHILVGQDTDSESLPAAAAMPWIVKLDKPSDFIGRWALERADESEPESVLVGFRIDHGPAPTEGSVVVLDGKPVGQVTSSRRSPKLGGVIGMAWVPAELARDDAQLTISDDRATFVARVSTKPFYDPDGEVLRS